ncbi:hypothetical protein QTO34_014298 [Cnephaeus nilssonii]|uniref:cGMP-dependent protein kinase interacting domain-containing protein n=1 Tax=Cnephaeus nilssonii TaxID=3371016 RepID=A0AA40I736_CNENI|nr:hypothetical protein QTO34_014298 [Eptesicus nilssonii]
MIRQGKAKPVILINSCPALRTSEIEYYVLFTKTGVHYYSGNNIELCMACGKHDGACTWAIINQLKVELEGIMQRQECFAERPALLELERFECRALEPKAAELEEELKGLSNLQADNQRLKDENVALIHIISKLSKCPLRTCPCTRIYTFCHTHPFPCVNMSDRAAGESLRSHNLPLGPADWEGRTKSPGAKGHLRPGWRHKAEPDNIDVDDDEEEEDSGDSDDGVI